MDIDDKVVKKEVVLSNEGVDVRNPSGDAFVHMDALEPEKMQISASR